MQLTPAMRAISNHRGGIAILALGIGMSVAMFSLVDAVLLRPLPFPEQDRIEVLWKTDPQAGALVVEMAYPELRDLQASVSDFESIAMMPTSLYGYGRVVQLRNAAPVQVECAPVSHDFFRVLQISPAMGRDFADSDEHPGAAPVVIVSDHVWREQLRTDPNIVGQMIRLNGQGYTVIGVMAPAIDFPRGAGIWIPLGVDSKVVERRGATFLQAIARLKPGATRENAAAQVNALFTRLAAEYRIYPRGQSGVLTPLVEYWSGSARIHLWIMMGASLLLLVAAAISAGNLFLSHALSRRQEIATRAALGARPAQILMQFGVEGIAAGGIAAVLGLAIAEGFVRFLVRWSSADIPRLADASVDIRSFLFATTAAVFAATVCSILPGWLLTRSHLEAALRSGGARLSISRFGQNTQSAFVFAQAAVTVILLAAAGLLTASYRSMMTADTGFAHRDAVSMNVALRGPGVLGGGAIDPKTRRAFYTTMLNRLREAPGVTSAGAVLLRPLEGTIGWDVDYQFEFEAARENHLELPRANFEAVTPGYFETVGTPLLEGRDFDQHDEDGGEKVAIIGSSLAKRIRESGRSPIGERVRMGRSGDWMKVVGVTAAARYRTVTQAEEDLYVPYLQAAPPTNYVVIRGAMPPEELAALVRRTLAAMDPNQAVAGVATIGALIDRNMARHRFNMIMLLWFGICAAILAATGVYSVIAESVMFRRREIAIKTALGARKPRLVRETIVRVLVFVLAGEVVGAGGVVGFGRLGSELLYRVSASDPLIAGLALGFVSAVSLAAALWPAWIAAGRDPNAALHEV